MRIALGCKARIGRATLVAVGSDGAALKLVACDEVKLLPEGAFAPYHAADGLPLEEAQRRVASDISTAHRLAQQAIRDVIRRMRDAGHKVAGCGVLVGTGMPNWTIAEILAVHVRMHKAEGELFRNALAEGAKALKLRVRSLPQQMPFDAAARELNLSRTGLNHLLAGLGKQAGPPWGQHQKEAAVAAIAVLRPTVGGGKTTTKL